MKGLVVVFIWKVVYECCKVTFSIFFVSKIRCKVAKIIAYFRLLMIYSFLLFIEYRISRIPAVFGFFDDSALRKTEFFLSLIVFLYCFLSSSYFWCSFGFLLSSDFIRDRSNFWRSLTLVGSFIQGAIGWVNFIRCVGAWHSKQSVKSSFKVDIWPSGSSNATQSYFK